MGSRIKLGVTDEWQCSGPCSAGPPGWEAKQTCANNQTGQTARSRFPGKGEFSASARSWLRETPAGRRAGGTTRREGREQGLLSQPRSCAGTPALWSQPLEKRQGKRGGSYPSPKQNADRERVTVSALPSLGGQNRAREGPLSDCLVQHG